jgi:predicted dehydrogenase
MNSRSLPHYSRRAFLNSLSRASVAALGIPTFVPASALGRGGAVAPSERINMGCIGWGQIAPGDLGECIKHPDVQFVAVCEIDRSRKESAQRTVENFYASKTHAGEYKGCATYHDFREMLARPDIDAVIVAVPDHWHALMVVAAARAGKDIYCEKPLSLTIEEGKAMRDAVQRYGRVLQTGSQSRSKRNTRHAGELVLNGRIGELKTVKVGLPTSPYYPKQPVMPVPDGFDYDFWLGPAPWAPYTEKRCHIHYRWILDYSDGMIADWGAHQLDLAQWGMGMQLTGPVWVEGKGKFPRDGLSDVATEFEFKCGYSNGIVLECSTSFEGGVKFEGTKGWVHTGHGGFFRSDPESLVNEVIGPNEIHLYDSPDHHRNFLDCVRSRAVPIAPVEVAHRTATICHLANITMLLGHRVNWDPVKEQCVNDPQATRMQSRAMRPPWNLL